MYEGAREVRIAFRALRRAPAHAVVAIAALALGIGGVTLVFSVVATLLLSPVPYQEPERLVVVQPNPSWELFQQWRAANAACDRVAAYNERAMNLAGDARDPERIVVGRITDDFLSLTGTTAAMGRAFSVQDFRAGAENVVLLSDALWRRRFAASPDIVGRTVTLDDRVHVIVGVLRPEFKSPPELPSARALSTERGATLLTPLRGDPRTRTETTTDRVWRGLNVIARLRPGITLDRARTELHTIARHVPERGPVKATYTLVTLPDYVAGDVPKQIAVLIAAVGLLLFAGCANAANVVLARTWSRSGEMATRVALGASRRQLVRHVLSECLVLGVAGGVLGAGLAWVGSRLIAGLGGSVLSRLDAVCIDVRVLAFAATVSFGSAAAVGVIPGLRVSKADPVGALKTTHGASPGPSTVRSLLVVTEVALALVVLIAAGLLGNDFVRLARVDLGFRPAGVVIADVALNPAHYASAAERTAFFQVLLERLAALPGVQSVGMATNAPGGTSVTAANLQINSAADGAAGPHDADSFVRCEIVGGSYFRTVSIPLRAGRALNERDTATSAFVVVNEALARKCWGEPAAALNRHVRFAESAFSVVGVAADTRPLASSVQASPLVYFAYDQFPVPPSQMTLLLHGFEDVSPSAATVRSAVRDVNSSQPVYNALPLERIVQAPLMRRRLLVTMTALFAVFTLLVASTGVYGALSCSVTERMREIGVRLALGGRPRSVFALTVGRGLKLVLLGVTVGIPLALSTTFLFASQLVEVSRTDAATCIGSALVVTAVGLAGCVVPAYCAMRVDPIRTLRSE